MRNQKKHCPDKPGSVLTKCQCLSFIYCARHHAPLAFYPPSYSRSGGQPFILTETMVYMNLQPPDGTARRSPAAWWSLTPPSHPYPTPTVLLAEPERAYGAVVLFFHIQLSPTASTFRSEAPSAARTFLSSLL